MTLRDRVVTPTSDPVASLGIRGEHIEIIAEFEIEDATRFGLRVREGGRERTTIGYDVRLREIFVDRRDSGRHDFNPDFAKHHHAPMHIPEDNRITLRVVVDASSVEVSGNDGIACITDRISADSASDGVSAFAEDGAVRLVRFEAFPLRSIWADE